MRRAQVVDLGSLNGTSLQSRIISTSNRRKGKLWRLNDGDELKLGVHTIIKIAYLPLTDAPVRPPDQSSSAPRAFAEQRVCCAPLYTTTKALKQQRGVTWGPALACKSKQ